MATPVLAIDFGTYESSARVVIDGDIKEDYVPDPGTGNEQADWRSSVYWDGARLLVGRAAQEQWTTEPGRYRAEFKPLLGGRLPVALGDPDGRKRNFLPEDLVAEFLAAMREAADTKYQLAVKQAVITVPPAYFELDGQRAKLMLAAADEAGFKERVELIREPVAAALAEPAGGRFAVGTCVLVYDFGGGTFDAAIVRVGVDGANAHALSTDGCGGMHVDATIQAWLGEHYPAIGALISRGVADDEGLSAARGLMYVSELCETLKRRLSAPGADVVGMRSDSLDLHVTMKGEDLDECAADIIGKTISCCKELLREAGKTPADLDAILLVGGSSRLRGVREGLVAGLGVRKDIIRATVRPTLAVVDGAAIFAAQSYNRVSWRTRDDPRARALRWDIPGDRAAVVRWHARENDSYRKGQELADLRLGTGEIYRLVDDEDGTVARRHAGEGQDVRGGDWLLTSWRPFNGGWEAPLGAIDAAPALSDRTVFVGTRSGTVYALASATREIWWRQDLHVPVTAPPAIRHGHVHVGCEDGRLYTLDQRTGKPVEAPTHPVNAAITSAPLWAGGRTWVTASSGMLFGLAPDGTAAQFECAPGTRPVLSGPMLCVRDAAGSLYGIDPYRATMAPNWNAGLFGGHGQHTAAGAMVYEYYGYSGIRRLSGLTGHIEADQKELVPNPADKEPSAHGNGGLAAAARRRLQQGLLSPGASTEPLLLAAPVCATDLDGRETVYVGTTDGRLFALEADTLKPREQAQIASGESATPAINFLTFADGTLYVGAADSTVYMVGARAGLPALGNHSIVASRGGLPGFVAASRVGIPGLKEQVGIAITAGPVIGHGAVLVTAADGVLRAFPSHIERTS
jgi:molecular chaperone DnaK